MNTSERNQKTAIVLGGVTVLLWSTVATAFKLSLRELTPVQLLLIACMTSTLVLGAILLVQGRLKQVFRMSGRDYLVSMGLGSLNPTLYYLVLFGAFDRLPAQEAQPLNYTWALVLTYLSVPFLHQRLSRWDVVAGLVCYAGVVVIATRGQLGSLTFSDPLGVGLALLSTVIWAVYWIVSTRDHREPVIGLFLNFVFALPLVALVCLGTDGLPDDVGSGFLAAIYVGVFEMGVAFVLWLLAMKKAENTSQLSNLIFVSPFLSLVFIHFILGETILLSTYVGLALIVAGLWTQQAMRAIAARSVTSADR